MNTPNLSLIIHGILALAIVAAVTVLSVTLKTVPPDVAGLFGVVLGVAGVNGSGAVRTFSDDRQNARLAVDAQQSREAVAAAQENATAQEKSQ